MSLSRECIIGTHQALDGLLTAPHIQLNPPFEDGLKFGLIWIEKFFFLKTELVSSNLRTVVIKLIYSPTRFF